MGYFDLNERRSRSQKHQDPSRLKAHSSINWRGRSVSASSLRGVLLLPWKSRDEVTTGWAQSSSRGPLTPRSSLRLGGGVPGCTSGASIAGVRSQWCGLARTTEQGRKQPCGQQPRESTLGCPDPPPLPPSEHANVFGERLRRCSVSAEVTQHVSSKRALKIARRGRRPPCVSQQSREIRRSFLLILLVITKERAGVFRMPASCERGTPVAL